MIKTVNEMRDYLDRCSHVLYEIGMLEIVTSEVHKRLCRVNLALFNLRYAVITDREGLMISGN